jgi:hypothetical protein
MTILKIRKKKPIADFKILFCTFRLNIMVDARHHEEENAINVVFLLDQLSFVAPHFKCLVSSIGPHILKDV